MPAYSDKLWTFQDAVERVLDTFDEQDKGRNLRQAKEAVINANRDIASWHDWQWYMSKYDFLTDAVYSTGTVEYTASTKTLVLTGGTWPTNALYMEVGIGNRRYEVASVESTTSLTLVTGPTEDQAAGTLYSIFRTEYALPSAARKNFDQLDTRTDTSPWEVRYVPEMSVLFVDRSIYYRYTTLNLDLPLPYYEQPQWFTIGRNRNYESGYSIRFAQIPKTESPYTLTYWREPRNLKVYKVVGPASVSGTTVTASAGLEFTSEHVGSMIRFSADENEPTAAWGGIGTTNPDNPFVYQEVIASVESSTSCTLAVAAPSAISGTAVISDPLDIDHELMLSGFLSAAEFFFARRQKRKDLGLWKSEFQRELSLAKEYDEDYRISRGNSLYGAY